LEQQRVSDNKPEASATTCIVGCKLPHGLKLEIKVNDGAVVSHTLKGTNASRIVGANGAGVGYGLTDGIPTDFMLEWFKRNEKHPAVTNGSIFMHTSEKSAVARAREGREIRTGIEPIDPMQDPRFVRETDTKKLVLDKDAEASYRKQKLENPARGRQIVE
jgi:hypothetical protein